MDTLVEEKSALEEYFSSFRNNVVGNREKFMTPYGEKELIYADWTASGRLYRPIEKIISEHLGPFVGNTHTETTVTGTSMTKAYHKAHQIIKKHVNASENDVIITTDSGMTGVVNKFQRILGLKVPEDLMSQVNIPETDRPVVFVTHMEHHSNHTSWLETIADVECIMPDDEGLIDMNNLKELLNKYRGRKTKIASITACSNVTGIHTDYHSISKIVHEEGGLCFVDFACSAPYQEIDMHPEDPDERLDAIYFSPHKFLGGPGSTGVLIFDSSLYTNTVPDQVGGGTVAWTNPWGEHKYFDNIEVREDGGTPAFLQTIKASLCVKLKEKMGVNNMLRREKELVKRALDGLSDVDGVRIMAGDRKDRLAVISFYLPDHHFNLVVKLLNDRFGIQTRGGCSCAGTYGHYLLHISKSVSNAITDKIDLGFLEEKPGWVRMSFHPVMTNNEVDFILDAIKAVVENGLEWSKDYIHDNTSNEFYHKDNDRIEANRVTDWFDFDLLS